MKSVINFVCVYVCTIIGASFITGNEIYMFFALYGGWAYFLMGICFVLFVCTSITIFCKCKKANITNILDAFSSGVVAKVMQAFTYITYFMFASVMLAGLRELFGILFTLICAIICVYLIKKGISSIVKINAILFPFVIIYLIVLSVMPNNGQTCLNVQSLSFSAVFNIFTYVSLNVILILGSMLKLTSKMSKRQIIASTVLSGFVFALLIVFQIIILQGSEIQDFNMPLLYIASKNNFVYAFALMVAFCAMISSYLSSIYSMYVKINKSKCSNFYLTILICSIVCFSFLGFARIVQFSYIFLGCVSFVLMAYLCAIKFKKK